MVDSPNARTAKSFDLRKNPLFLFRLEPTASLEKITDAYEDAVADQIASESDLAAAREALVNPRQRLAVELSFLFDTPPGQVNVICTALENRASSDDLVRAADRLAPLSKANLLTHAGAQWPSKDDLLFALMGAHAGIEPETIHKKLDSTRSAAGFIVPSLDSVRDQLHDLLALHSKSVFEGYATAVASAEPVSDCTKRILASADSDRIDALEGLVRSYGQTIASELHHIEEAIRCQAQDLRENPKDASLVNPIAEQLRAWISLAYPIVEFDAHKGRDEARARQLFNEVRGLAIDLANQYNSFDVALSIINSAAEVFSSLPRANEQLKEDRLVLEERSAEALLIPLNAYLTDLSKWTIVPGLLNSGFGPSAIGSAKELWDLFFEAAKQTQNTMAADLPWILLRSLAIDINNDEGSPSRCESYTRGPVEFHTESSTIRRDIGKNLRGCAVVSAQHSRKASYRGHQSQ